MDPVTLGMAKADARKNYAPASLVTPDALTAADAASLRPFVAALGSRATAPVDVLAIGDSISEGEGSGSVADRWISRFLTSLRAQFQALGITGGRGYIPAWYAFTSPSPSASGFTPSGSGVTQSNIYGLGRRSATLTAGGTLTITVDCSSFDLCYPQLTAGGVVSVAIDGGAPVNVDTTAGGNLGGRVQRFTPQQRGSHTIVISYVSGTPVVDGIMVYDGDETKGVRLWDGAHYGYTSGSFVSDGRWSESIAMAGPDLVLLALGTNDFGTNVAPATFKSNLSSIVTTVRGKVAGVPILVVAMPERAGSFSAPWKDYVTAMAEVVATGTNLAFVDLSKRFAKGSTADPDGFITADGVHPTARGHQAISDYVSGRLLSGVRGGTFVPGSVDAAGNVTVPNGKTITLQRKTGAGQHGSIRVNTANQMDVQLAGGSLRFANNAYDSILLEISNGGTIILGTNGPQIRYGDGSPEGVVTAPPGSLFLNRTGSGAAFWVKETGLGNTGWIGK